MCLVVVARDASAEFPFVLAANRDELFARPSAAASWWSHEGVDIFGGRDLEKGGTWLGVTRARRIAVVTNVRDSRSIHDRRVLGSRGWLTRDALVSKTTPLEIARDEFPSFNLLIAEGDALFYLRDDEPAAAVVAPGVHGLSNARLDTPWPKVTTAIGRASKTHDPDELFALLATTTVADDDALPHTGVPLEIERVLSAPFVRAPAMKYGTRCSTVVMRDAHGALHFEERTFDEAGAVTSRIRETI